MLLEHIHSSLLNAVIAWVNQSPCPVSNLTTQGTEPSTTASQFVDPPPGVWHVPQPQSLSNTPRVTQTGAPFSVFPTVQHSSSMAELDIATYSGNNMNHQHVTSYSFLLNKARTLVKSKMSVKDCGPVWFFETDPSEWRGVSQPEPNNVFRFQMLKLPALTREPEQFQRHCPLESVPTVCSRTQQHQA